MILKGTTFSALHFVPGQFIDVVANSYVFTLYYVEELA